MAEEAKNLRRRKNVNTDGIMGLLGSTKSSRSPRPWRSIYMACHVRPSLSPGHSGVKTASTRPPEAPVPDRWLLTGGQDQVRNIVGQTMRLTPWRRGHL